MDINCLKDKIVLGYIKRFLLSFFPKILNAIDNSKKQSACEKMSHKCEHPPNLQFIEKYWKVLRSIGILEKHWKVLKRIEKSLKVFKGI